MDGLARKELEMELIQIAGAYREDPKYRLVRPWREERVIINNTEEVYEEFERLSNPDSSKYMQNTSEADRLLAAIKRVKMELFYRAIHKDYEKYDKLPPKEQARHNKDREFIRQHFDEIESRFVQISEDVYDDRLDGMGIAEKAVMQTRAIHYAKTICLDASSPKLSFIVHNIREIHSAYEELDDPYSPKYMGKSSERRKIEAAIREAGKRIAEKAKRKEVPDETVEQEKPKFVMPDWEWREEDWPEEDQVEEEPTERDWRDDDYMR